MANTNITVNPTSEGGGWNPSPPQENAYKCIVFGPARCLLEAQEPPFWSLVLIFGSKNSNFWTFLGVLGVRLDWDMCPDIYLCPMDHVQPLLGFVFIILYNLTISPLIPIMDFRGAQGQPLGGF